MVVNDTVMQVKGSAVLLGRVYDTKKKNDWTYVKVKWVPTDGLRSLQNNLERMLEIRRQEIDSELEWIRCDKLVKIDTSEILNSVNTLIKQGPCFVDKETFNGLSRLGKMCVRAREKKILNSQ